MLRPSNFKDEKMLTQTGTGTEFYKPLLKMITSPITNAVKNLVERFSDGIKEGGTYMVTEIGSSIRRQGGDAFDSAATGDERFERGVGVVPGTFLRSLIDSGDILIGDYVRKLKGYAKAAAKAAYDGVKTGGRWAYATLVAPFKNAAHRASRNVSSMANNAADQIDEKVDTVLGGLDVFGNPKRHSVVKPPPLLDPDDLEEYVPGGKACKLHDDVRVEHHYYYGSKPVSFSKK